MCENIIFRETNLKFFRETFFSLKKKIENIQYNFNI